MTALFTAIRKSDLDKVKSIIEKQPLLVNSVAKAPPKKDDGQSALQVAIKSSNPEIAEYLIDKGADINFVDSSQINVWHAPVIHDVVMACIYLCTDSQSKKLTQYLGILKKMIQKGADLKVVDSYGNTVMHRAFLDARQLEHFYSDKKVVSNIKKIIDLLKESGASLSQKSSTREAVLHDNMFAKHPVSMFF